MLFVRLNRCLTFSVVFAIASSASAQTTASPPSQTRLEIAGEYAGAYWIVETAADGSRRGGWVMKQTPLDRIDRSTLQPIPRQRSEQVTTAPQLPEAGNIDERLTRIERSLAGGSGASTPTAQPVAPMQYAPAQQVPTPTQPQAFTPRVRHPQTREGFWFNAGMGLGFAGCLDCVGTNAGASGGLSLGGTLSEKWLLGVGTSGWYRSYEGGVSLSGGTTDARFRFYPSLRSGFFINGGLGLGHITVGLRNFDSVSETGVGALFGVGWDIRIKPNVSLTPFYNGFAVQTSNADGHVDQFGLGVTIH
jgi:hypothetical protein